MSLKSRTRKRLIRGAGIAEYLLILVAVALGAVTAIRHLGQVAQQQTATMAQELAGVNAGTNGGPGSGDVGTGRDLPGSDFNDGGADTGGSTGGGGGGSGGNGGTGSGGGGSGGTGPGNPEGGDGDGGGDGAQLPCITVDPEEVKEDVIAKLKEFEGDIAWMYLDINGYVTVGIGHLLESASEAKGLNFYMPDPDEKSGERLATDDEIETAFDKVKKQPSGKKHPASDYEDVTTLRIKEKDRVAWVKDEVDSTEQDLEDQYPDFKTYPAKVRKALYDMRYNLGNKLENEFPKFNKAIKARDWQTAADESHRIGPQPSRNDYVKNLLEDAAAEKSEKKVCSDK